MCSPPLQQTPPPPCRASLHVLSHMKHPMPTHRHRTLGLLCVMLATASAQDDASWIEALDPASGKKCAPDHVSPPS